jgi:hypothetical protein
VIAAKLDGCMAESQVESHQSGAAEGDQAIHTSRTSLFSVLQSMAIKLFFYLNISNCVHLKPTLIWFSYSSLLNKLFNHIK